MEEEDVISETPRFSKSRPCSQPPKKHRSRSRNYDSNRLGRRSPLSTLQTNASISTANIMKTQVVKNTAQNSYSISSIGNSYYTQRCKSPPDTEKENKCYYINFQSCPQPKEKEQTDEFSLLITKIETNKKQIKHTRRKVDQLEGQIGDISEKLDGFKKDTDQIIEAISRRIQQAERTYEENSDPKSPSANCDVTMNKVKTCVKNTFEHFRLTCQEDFKYFNKAINAEVKAFKEFLKYKKKDLKRELKKDFKKILPRVSRK
ncbi:unnamed protein product [Moneuplotes crassus]|uniref:Uncharacterized protein n=1 Tax=Euplotes crassus TaxID=5936 RepID=A0AAD1XRC1_EUPCR|nr:unnamed protein product [Moneuplotes crassus]